jgi:hypothetical protein
MDIFKGKMWYCYTGEFSAFVELDRRSVHDIIGLNKSGENPSCLEDFCEEKEEAKRLDFENVVGQEDVSRFDKKRPQSRNKRKKRRKKPANRAENGKK